MASSKGKALKRYWGNKEIRPSFLKKEMKGGKNDDLNSFVKRHTPSKRDLK